MFASTRAAPIAAVAMVCALIGATTMRQPSMAQEVMSEARIKAALVANLILFIEWRDADGPLNLCVAGRGDSADAVRALNARQLKRRTVEAIPVASPVEVTGRGCHLLFIAASTGARAVEYAQASAGNPTVIVSEDDALALDRSHIVMALEERRPVLEVNLSAARRLGIDISARLLKLARKVV